LIIHGARRCGGETFTITTFLLKLTQPNRLPERRRGTRWSNYRHSQVGRVRFVRSMGRKSRRSAQVTKMRRIPNAALFFQDLHHGIRVLRRDRAFTVFAVVALALGI